MTEKLLISILLLILIIGCKAQNTKVKDPQSTIETSIDDCISLLEKKEYKTIFEKYIYPEDLKKILQDMTIDKLTLSFAEKKADRMLKGLKIARNKKIEYKENGSVGIIDLGEVESGPKDFVFRKVKDLWYISNE
jgi:hypothetical protein